jgi:hypothetical protein
MQSAYVVIKKKNIPKAFKAIKSLAEKHDYLGWVDPANVRKARNFAAAMKAFRWEVYFSKKTGDTCELNFKGEKLGCERMLFDTLAPFIENHSEISMAGEENSYWKWVFWDGKCSEKQGVIEYY